MTKELEQKFVADLEENQNIVHKVCKIYTNNQDAHNDLFQEISIQLWKDRFKHKTLTPFYIK